MPIYVGALHPVGDHYYQDCYDSEDGQFFVAVYDPNKELIRLCEKCESESEAWFQAYQFLQEFGKVENLD